MVSWRSGPVTGRNTNIRYRQHVLGLHVSPVRIRISAQPTGAMPIHIGIRDEIHLLQAGEEKVFSL